MKHFLASIIALLIVSACGTSKTHVNKQSNENCKSLRTGKFIIEDDRIDHTSVIIRNDSIQYEKDITTGYDTNFKIDWIDDCTYTLLPINPGDDIPDIMKDKKLVVVIDSVKNGVQYFTSYLQGYEDNKLNGAIRKLE